MTNHACTPGDDKDYPVSDGARKREHVEKWRASYEKRLRGYLNCTLSPYVPANGRPKSLKS